MIQILIAQARLPQMDGAFLLQFLGAVALLAAIYLMALAIFGHHKKKAAAEVVVAPNPLRTQKVPDLATRAELEAMSARIEAELDEVKAAAMSREATREAQVVALHNRMNLVAEGVGAIRGQIDELAKNQRLIMERFLK